MDKEIKLPIDINEIKSFSEIQNNKEQINTFLNDQGFRAIKQRLDNNFYINAEIKQNDNLLSIALYVKHKVKDKGPTPKIAVKHWQESKKLLSKSLKSITKNLEEK